MSITQERLHALLTAAETLRDLYITHAKMAYRQLTSQTPDLVELERLFTDPETDIGVHIGSLLDVERQRYRDTKSRNAYERRRRQRDSLGTSSGLTAEQILIAKLQAPFAHELSPPDSDMETTAPTELPFYSTALPIRPGLKFLADGAVRPPGARILDPIPRGTEILISTTGLWIYDLGQSDDDEEFDLGGEPK